MYRFLSVLLSGNPYDIYSKSQTVGKYSDLTVKTWDILRNIFHIILQAGVYMSAVSFIAAGAMIVIASRGKSEKLAEAKGFLVKVMIISILVFGVGNLVDMVIAMGLD